MFDPYMTLREGISSANRSPDKITTPLIGIGWITGSFIIEGCLS